MKRHFLAYTNEKAVSARIFYGFYEKVKNNDTYKDMKIKHQSANESK